MLAEMLMASHDPSTAEHMEALVSFVDLFRERDPTLLDELAAVVRPNPTQTSQSFTSSVCLNVLSS